MTNRGENHPISIGDKIGVPEGEMLIAQYNRQGGVLSGGSKNRKEDLCKGELRSGRILRKTEPVREVSTPHPALTGKLRTTIWRSQESSLANYSSGAGSSSCRSAIYRNAEFGGKRLGEDLKRGENIVWALASGDSRTYRSGSCPTPKGKAEGGGAPQQMRRGGD